MHGEAPDGVNDDLPDAYLFNIEMVPRWSEPMIPILGKMGQINTGKQKQETDRDFF